MGELMDKNIQVGHEFLSSKIPGRTCKVTCIGDSMVSYQYRGTGGFLINSTKHVKEFKMWYHVPEASNEWSFKSWLKSWIG